MKLIVIFRTCLDMNCNMLSGSCFSQKEHKYLHFDFFFGVGRFYYKSAPYKVAVSPKHHMDYTIGCELYQLLHWLCFKL